VLRLNDPIYVAHSGFYIDKGLDTLALATVGFLVNQPNFVAVKLCLYLLTTRDHPTLNTQVRNMACIQTKARLPPSVEVRKRAAPNVVVGYRKAPTINTNYRLPASVVTSRRVKPLIEIYVDNCD
jgi:hypothetical protein